MALAVLAEHHPGFFKVNGWPLCIGWRAVGGVVGE